MNNYLQDCQSTEIVETLEDYIFGSYVQCFIPTMMALLDTNYKTTSKISTKNIMNKNKEILGITSYKPSSYVSIFIPKEYANIDDIKTYIDKKYNDIKNYIDDKCNNINQRIDNVHNDTIQYIDSQIASVRNEISNIQNNQIENINILSLSEEDIYEDIDFLSGGKKGDKYIISFIGGDINNCQVIGRYNG